MPMGNPPYLGGRNDRTETGSDDEGRLAALPRMYRTSEEDCESTPSLLRVRRHSFGLSKTFRKEPAEIMVPAPELRLDWLCALVILIPVGLATIGQLGSVCHQSPECESSVEEDRQSTRLNSSH